MQALPAAGGTLSLASPALCGWRAVLAEAWHPLVSPRRLQVLVAFSIDTDALGLLSRCAKCNGEFENRCKLTQLRAAIWSV